MDNYLRPQGGYGELRNYDPPWYDQAADYLTAMIYGENANAQQTAGIENLVGPQNPFNFPAQATQGVNTAMQGYDQGDYGQMASGGAQAALSALPLFGARALMPSVRAAHTARAKNALYPNEPVAFAGRPQPGLDDFINMRHAGSQNRGVGRMSGPANDTEAQYARVSGRIRRLPGGTPVR